MTDFSPDPDHVDAVFDCLAHPRRRYVLRRLRDVAVPLSLTDLAADVATWEASVPRSDVDEETIREVRLVLYHCHIPKLTEADLVEYDRDRGVIEIGEYPAELEADSSPRVTE